MHKQNLEARVLMAMGGRAAEDIVYGNDEVTTGCGSDLVNATRVGFEMTRRFGMTDTNYLLSLSKQELSDKTNYQIDLNVQKYLNESYDRAKSMLMDNRDKLDALAKELALKETLSKDEVKKLLSI